MAHRSVASVVGDVGGAEAVAPVLTALARRGDLGPVVASSAGASVLDRAGIAHRRDPVDWGAWLDEAAPSGLLTTTSWADPPMELAALEAARVRGIPSVAVVDFWANYRRRFTWPDGNQTWPDVIVVPDPVAALEAVADGVPADRVRPLGNPHYEHLLQRYRVVDERARAAFRERVGVRRHRTLVVFASQPIKALYGGALGYDEASVLQALCRAVVEVGHWLGHPIEIVVRAHPREDWRLEGVDTGGALVRLANTEEAMDWAMSADLVVGMTSAVLVQAALLGARVVSVQPNLIGPDCLPSNRLGLTDPIYDASDLAPGLYRALARPAHTQKARALLEARRAATGAAARIALLLETMTAIHAEVGG